MKMEAYEKQHLRRLRAILPECAVLLKSNGDFPLAKPGKIAAFGRGVRHTIKGGTGSGDVNSHFTVNIETALLRRGFEITTEGWLNDYDDVLEDAREECVREIKARARRNRSLAVMEGMGAVMPEPEYDIPLLGEGGTAIYVLSRISGEGNDRTPVKGDILLTDTEIRDILRLYRTYPRFMLILNTGGPVDLTPVLEVENILLLSQLGVDTGLAAADILLGKMNPSGHLTTTWASWDAYPKIGEFGDINDTRYNEGIYVGYRYFDTTGEKPLFPFGHGLSYTDFEISAEGITADGEQITVSCEVENTGAFSGKEVVQLYVSKPAGKLDQPFQVLAGFAKTRELAPGERQLVDITFKMSDLASYDTGTAAWICEKGLYVLRLGNSSAGTAVCGALRLDETAEVFRVRNLLGRPDFRDYSPAPVPADENIDEEDILDIKAEDLPFGEAVYGQEEEIDPLVAALPDAKLAYLSLGHFDRSGIMGAMSIIGNAAQSVAGAAGETSDILEEDGIGTLVMADGPAGLRLNQKYILNGDGKAQAVGSSLPAGMAEFLPGFAAFFMDSVANRKPRRGNDVRTQYCTAIPIGSAIAMSWNPDAAELCGDIVGSEMERFGIDLWLAPALNIHRSILCGRNFEYYSEDPLISGIMAAAITAGVQKHPGRGTTIKHFAANNQETNRLASNSQVSERAMREIYLKGFEICVKKAQPLALMTSYNLLNGTHTSARRDLTTEILREEWGFRGIVMTDWVINMMMNRKSVYPGACASKTVKAGGDLYMPGGPADFKNLMDALKSGELTRADLERTGTRVLRMVLKMKEAQKQ